MTPTSEAFFGGKQNERHGRGEGQAEAAVGVVRRGVNVLLGSTAKKKLSLTRRPRSAVFVMKEVSSILVICAAVLVKVIEEHGLDTARSWPGEEFRVQPLEEVVVMPKKATDATGRDVEGDRVAQVILD